MIDFVYAIARVHLAYTAFPLLDWFSHVAEFQPWFADIETVMIRHVFITDIHQQLGPSVLFRLLFVVLSIIQHPPNGHD
jgi:hypothetical protein